ncbi:hypothetical protein ZWY2020_046594, partial [Hordeum vulgare]
LFGSVMCSYAKLNSHRFKDIIDQEIAEGKLKSTKAYVKWAKKISEIEPPTNPLERRVKKKKSQQSDLILAISQCRAQRKEQRLEKKHTKGQK